VDIADSGLILAAGPAKPLAARPGIAFVSCHNTRTPSLRHARMGVTMRFVSTLLGLVIGDLLGRLLFIPLGWPFDSQAFVNRIGVLAVTAFVICFVWDYVRDRFGWFGGERESGE
jgi:hypothetical protein